MQVRVRFEVERNYRGWRLDAYLQQKLRRLAPEKLAFILAHRLEHDEPAPLTAESLVYPGLRFALVREVEPEPETPLHFGVVHDDGALVILEKPAGLPVHPTARYLVHTLTALVRARWPERKVDPAHRLDRETSGLLACGGAPEHTARLKRAFAAGRVTKSYLALCVGWPERDRFEVEVPLALTRASLVRVRMHVSPGGAPSHTAFEVLGRRTAPDGARLAMLSCHPSTGRQHQNPRPPRTRRLPAGGRQDLRLRRGPLRPVHAPCAHPRGPDAAPPRPPRPARLAARRAAPGHGRARELRGASAGGSRGAVGLLRVREE